MAFGLVQSAPGCRCRSPKSWSAPGRAAANDTSFRRALLLRAATQERRFMKITREKAERIARAHDLNLDSGMTVHEARKYRAERGAKARKLIDGARSRGGDMTPSEARDFDTLMDAADDLGALADYLEDEQARGFEDIGNRSGDRNGPDRHGSRDYRLGSWLRDKLLDNRQMGTGATSGGFLVPDDLSKELVDNLRPVMVTARAGARTVSVDTSKTSVPVVDADPTASWVAEHGLVPESEPALAERLFTPQVVSFRTKISLQLAQDGIDVEERLQGIFVKTVAQEIDRAALFGSGVDPEPEGLFNNAAISEHDMGTDGAALASYSPLLQARQLVLDANAEPGDRAAWIMAPRTETDLNDLTDTPGQPLQRPPSLENAQFMSTTSVPVDQAHGTAANASTILHGMWSDLWIGIRRDITVIPLRELYLENLQVGILVYARVDVVPVRPGSFVKITGIIP